MVVKDYAVFAINDEIPSAVAQEKEVHWREKELLGYLEIRYG